MIDRQPRVALVGAQPAAHLGAGDVGQHQVEQDQVRVAAAPARTCTRLAAGAGRARPEALLLEVVGQRVDDVGLVVDHQDQRLSRGFAGLTGRASCVATGCLDRAGSDEHGPFTTSAAQSRCDVRAKHVARPRRRSIGCAPGHGSPDPESIRLHLGPRPSRCAPLASAGCQPEEIVSALASLPATVLVVDRASA